MRVVKLGNDPLYENPQLLGKIAASRNNTMLDLRSSQLKDEDMEIVADELNTNTVGNYDCL